MGHNDNSSGAHHDPPPLPLWGFGDGHKRPEAHQIVYEKSTRVDATAKAADRIILPARQTPEQTPYTRPSPTAGRYSGWPAGPSRVQGGAQTGWYPAASHPTWQDPRAARTAEARLAAAVAAKQLASAQLASALLASVQVASA